MLALVLLVALSGAVITSVSAVHEGPVGASGGAIIVDHTATDIRAVPQEWIEAAKATLHIEYGHTSHGSQLTTDPGLLRSQAQGAVRLLRYRAV